VIGEKTKFEIAATIILDSMEILVILKISKNKISKISDQKDFKIKIKITLNEVI